MRLFKKVAILGVGLIGGSLGMGIVHRGLSRKVVGIGRHTNTLDEALLRGAVTHATTSLAEGVDGADLVIVATPISAIVDSIRSMTPFLADGAIVTDVGSTKQEIVAAAESLIPPGVSFVGGHPMAGSETAGVRFADRYLFEGAYYVLTPTSATSMDALQRVEGMASAVGARPVRMSPSAHDRAVAFISHLPHIAAVCLVNATADAPDKEQILPLAAGGFRDTTRVASGSPSIWRDILGTNREMIRTSIAAFRDELDHVDNLLATGDLNAIEHLLAAARDTRQSIPAKAKGYLRDLFELLINIPDCPGSIARVASELASRSLNISDLEVLRVREGEGGTVRLSFPDRVTRDASREILIQAGITVVTGAQE